jgi:hypothetical protein
MPVLGHVFVGWGTALAVSPRPARGAPADRTGALWVPLLVLLAYGPDIAAQAGLALGWAAAPRAAHSFSFALLVAPVAGLALGSILGVRRLQAAAVTLGSFVLHDVLDILQTPERQPLWPFSHWRLGEGAGLIPASAGREALLFAGAFALFVALTRIARPPAIDARRLHLHRPVTVGLVAVAVAAAATTHYLRGVRERQLGQARVLVEEGRFTEALGAAAGADRWPSTAHPGRVDHVRAEALEGLGNLEAAIAGYDRTVQADPSNFWALADLAAACARSPRDDRLALASSLRAQLLRDFSTHPALASAVARIDRRLARRRP